MPTIAACRPYQSRVTLDCSDWPLVTQLGAVVDAVRASCRGLLTEMSVSFGRAQIHVTLLTPRDVDLDALAAAIPLDAGRRLRASGVLEPDPQADAAAEAALTLTRRS